MCWQTVKPNPIGWKSTLTRRKSLQYRKPYWFLISDCVSSLHFSPAQEWRSPNATQIWCSSHVITCDWSAVVLLPQSHSRCSPAVSATLVRIVLPGIVFRVPEAQLAHLRWRGMGSVGAGGSSLWFPLAKYQISVSASATILLKMRD